VQGSERITQFLPSFGSQRLKGDFRYSSRLLWQPHNVLLGPNHHPVLTDFGSVSPARFTKKELKKMKTFLQEEANETTTESYCPPELFSFGGVLDDITIDERVDIWVLYLISIELTFKSLGCLLYAAAFHLNPFDREVMRGGSYRMAINNGKITIPNDSPYTESFHSLIRSMIIVDAAERPFIGQVISHTAKLLDPSIDDFDSD
jgi:serine/threonine protein kinase